MQLALKFQVNCFSKILSAWQKLKYTLHCEQLAFVSQNTRNYTGLVLRKDLEGKYEQEKSKKINPMGSAYFYVKTSDTVGGWGANFLVEWESEKKVS